MTVATLVVAVVAAVAGIVGVAFAWWTYRETGKRRKWDWRYSRAETVVAGTRIAVPPGAPVIVEDAQTNAARDALAALPTGYMPVHRYVLSLGVPGVTVPPAPAVDWTHGADTFTALRREAQDTLRALDAGHSPHALTSV